MYALALLQRTAPASGIAQLMNALSVKDWLAEMHGNASKARLMHSTLLTIWKRIVVESNDLAKVDQQQQANPTARAVH